MMKKKRKRKLCSCRGETLVETLTAILLIALISTALCAMVTASAKVNMQAGDSDRQLYKAVEVMENINAAQSVDPQAMGEDVRVVEAGPGGNLKVQIGEAPAPGNQPVFKDAVDFRVNYFVDQKMEKLVVYKIAESGD